MSNAARHLLRQIRRDPRLAYLIGPGSQSYDLLIDDVAFVTGRDATDLRREVEQSLKTEAWPDTRELVHALQVLLGDAEEADYMTAKEREQLARRTLADMRSGS
jgi:hypothetical protein